METAVEAFFLFLSAPREREREREKGRELEKKRGEERGKTEVEGKKLMMKPRGSGVREQSFFFFFESSLQPVSESSREGGLKRGGKRDTDSGSPGECTQTYAHTRYEPFKHNLPNAQAFYRQDLTRSLKLSSGSKALNSYTSNHKRENVKRVSSSKMTIP